MKVLIIINNHLTNLFMYAFYLQNKKKYLNHQFQFIVDHDIYNSKSSIVDKNLIKKFIGRFPKKSTFKNVKINKNYEKFFLKNILKFFVNCKENVNIINKNKFKVHQLIEKNYKEIWIGNSRIYDYLGKDILINRFEHGISDFPIFIILKKNWIKVLKLIFENFINKIFLDVNLIHENTTFITILKSKQFINCHKIKFIKSKFLIKSLEFFSIKKNFDKKNILINYPFDFIKIKKKINEIYAKICIKKLKYKKKFQSTKTIYLKGKYNYNNLKDFSLSLKKLTKKKIKILNPSAYINIEYYLLKMKPMIIISTINAGIYMFKNLLKKNFLYIKINKEFYEIIIKNTKEKSVLNSIKIWKKDIIKIKKFLKSNYFSIS